MTEEQQGGLQLETTVYDSRRQVLMSVIALNRELVQFNMEAALAAAPWGMGPIAMMGIKKTYKISRKDLWRLPIRLLSEMTDAQFDHTYDLFFPFLRDL
jgi:hypothetical protein